MTATRKSMRFLTVLALIFAMVLSIASVPVSAAGVETWYKGPNICPTINFYGSNNGNPKVMDISGKLTVSATFYPNGTNEKIYTLQICDVATNEILAGKSVISTTIPMNTYITIALNVTKGQQVYIRVIAEDASTRQKLSQDVQYTAYLGS